MLQIVFYNLLPPLSHRMKENQICVKRAETNKALMKQLNIHTLYTALSFCEKQKVILLICFPQTIWHINDNLKQNN